jgi:hypothetical protein
VASWVLYFFVRAIQRSFSIVPFRPPLFGIRLSATLHDLPFAELIYVNLSPSLRAHNRLSRSRRAFESLSDSWPEFSGSYHRHDGPKLFYCRLQLHFICYTIGGPAPQIRRDRFCRRAGPNKMVNSLASVRPKQEHPLSHVDRRPTQSIVFGCPQPGRRVVRHPQQCH